MRKLFVLCFVCLASFFGATVKAEVPQDVMAAYSDYSAALSEKDYNKALDHAQLAWKRAETSLGDSETTGNLAYNFGFLAIRLGEVEESIKPLTRSADLAHLTKEGGALIRLEREVELATALLGINKRAKAWKRLDKAREFAGENNIDDSVFAAELMVNQARIISDNANRAAQYSMNQLASRINKSDRPARIQSKSAQFSYDALAIFSSHPQTSRKEYIAMAHKLIGFSHERSKEWKEAVLAYQKTMEVQKTYSDINDRAYITTIGRWINVRTHFMHGIDNEEAYKQGLCKCWPFHKESKISAVPLKRIAPRMPSKALTSGFSIVRFDLDDEGNVVNPEILQSWPETVYDKSSMRSLKKWKYESKEDGKKGAQRTGIVSTIKYILTDYMGGDPI